jgi:hypothetical protein
MRRAVFLKEWDTRQDLPVGSLVLGNHEDYQLKELLAAGATRLADIPEVNGPSFFTVVLRQSRSAGAAVRSHHGTRAEGVSSNRLQSAVTCARAVDACL